MSSENATEPKLSPVEGHKAESQFLRGTLAEEFADPDARPPQRREQEPHQVPRQLPAGRPRRPQEPAKAGVGKAYMFMVRLKLPGGKLTADQYLAMDDICGKYANGTLRITTRQSFQFHGVLKTNLKPRIAASTTRSSPRSAAAAT